MSMGHIYAAKARAEQAMEHDNCPDWARIAFEFIADVLQTHIYETRPAHIPERLPRGPGAVNAWLDAQKKRREDLEAHYERLAAKSASPTRRVTSG